MNTCIYTKVSFEKAHGEHILQNFLGSRWTSNTIVTNDVQGKFGKTIDVALEEGLKSIRNIIGTKGGRGDSGPTLKNIRSSKGTKYHVEPGLKPKLAEPLIDISSSSDVGHRVSFELGSIEQLEWAISKIKEKFPDAKFNIDEIKNNIIKKKIYLDEPLHYKLSMGGNEYFRGMLKSIFNLLGAMNHNIAMTSEFDDVRNFILTGVGNVTKYIRWIVNDHALNIPTLYKFDHFIAVFSKKGCVEGIAQFYGDIPHLVKMSDRYTGEDFSYSYLVDPFRSVSPAEIRNSENFDKFSLPDFNEHSKIPDETVWGPYRARFSRILKKHYAKMNMDNIDDIITNFSSLHEGESFTPELINNLTEEIMKYIALRIARKQIVQQFC